MAAYFGRPELDLKKIRSFQLLAVCAKRGTSTKAFIWESCLLQNGLELKSLGVKIDSSLLPAVVSADVLW